MRRRRKPPSHTNHERWLVSYADFITLLFAFFVVLYASSKVDHMKAGKLAAAIQAAFQEMGVFQGPATKVPVNLEGPMQIDAVQEIENWRRKTNLTPIALRPDVAPGGGAENGTLAQLQHELEIILAPEIARKEISMGRELDGLVISLREAGFFESGSAQMKRASGPAFDRIAALLRKRKCRLRIEGHTDNIPIHNARFSSNWELSTSRATEIVRLLIVRDGFDAYHLSAAGYAEYHPAASNGTAEGRGQNRRVDIVILSEGPPAAAAASESAQEPVPSVSGANPLQ
jgi:chemotaxis protein MotB